MDITVNVGAQLLRIEAMLDVLIRLTVDARCKNSGEDYQEALKQAFESVDACLLEIFEAHQKLP